MYTQLLIPDIIHKEGVDRLLRLWNKVTFRIDSMFEILQTIQPLTDFNNFRLDNLNGIPSKIYNSMAKYWSFNQFSSII